MNRLFSSKDAQLYRTDMLRVSTGIVAEFFLKEKIAYQRLEKFNLRCVSVQGFDYSLTMISTRGIAFDLHPSMLKSNWALSNIATEPIILLAVS